MSGFARFRVSHSYAYDSRPRELAIGNRLTSQSLGKENQPQRMSPPISLDEADSLMKVHNSEDSTNKCRQTCDQHQRKMEIQMACEQDKVVTEEAVKLGTEFDRVMRSVELLVQETEQVIDSKSQNKPVDSKESNLEWLGLIVRHVCRILQISQQPQQFCLNKHDVECAEETNTTVAWEEQSQNGSGLLASKSAHGYTNGTRRLCPSETAVAAAVGEKEKAEACFAVARKNLQEACLKMKMELDRTQDDSIVAKNRLEEQAVELRCCGLIEKQFSTLQTQHDATLEELANVRGAVREVNEQYLGLQTEHNITLNDLARMRDRVGELEGMQEKKILLCEQSAAREITLEEKLKQTLDAPTAKHVKSGWNWCLPKNYVSLMTGGCIS